MLKKVYIVNLLQKVKLFWCKFQHDISHLYQ